MLFNPTKFPLNVTVAVPLYYTGLTDTALVSLDGGAPMTMTLQVRCSARCPRPPVHTRTQPALQPVMVFDVRLYWRDGGEMGQRRCPAAHCLCCCTTANRVVQLCCCNCAAATVLLQLCCCNCAAATVLLQLCCCVRGTSPCFCPCSCRLKPCTRSSSTRRPSSAGVFHQRCARFVGQGGSNGSTHCPLPLPKSVISPPSFNARFIALWSTATALRSCRSPRRRPRRRAPRFPGARKCASAARACLGRSGACA
jgi:hypothetical protein